MKKLICFLVCFMLVVLPVYADQVDDVVQNAVIDEADPESSVVQNEQTEKFDLQGVVNNDDVVADGEAVEDGSATDGDEIDSEKSVTINANEVTIVDNSEPEIEPYVVPSTPIAGGWYIQANTSQLGDVKIYVPVNYKEGSFAYTNDNIISLQASTITGVMYSSSGVYSIRFSAFDSPQYRTYDTGYTYAELSIDEVYSSNVEILDSDPPKVIPSYVYWVVLILIVGVICICKFMML